MSRHFMTFLLIVGLFTLNVGGHAQDARDSKNKRTFYVVKHGDAKELATVLGKHFKGDAEVQVLPDSASNCLLINAAPNVFEEVVKLLEQLDKRPHQVSVELLIAEVTPKKGRDGNLIEKAIDEKDFTGSSKEVLEKVEALKKDGFLGSLKRIQLTAVENQPASAIIGETKPVVSAVTRTATGIVSRSITYRNTGTQAKVMVRVADENSVTIDLDVEDARLHVPEDGIEIGKDENGVPILATEFIPARLKTKLSVRSDQAIAAEGVKTDSKSGKARTLIIVSARVVETGAKGVK